MATLDATLRDARQDLAKAGLRQEGLAPGDADILLAHVLDRPRTWLHAHGDEPLASAASARFAALLARRIAGEPVAYLTGRQGFHDIDLAVTHATLIPRPETECLVELALARLPAGMEADVADLGTGSGAIALAIARQRPRARVLATDASQAALEVARANARALGLGNVAFVHGHWWRATGDARFDLVASNPPYVAEGDPHLGQGDLRHEPRSALASGPEGLDAIREIIVGASRHLRPGGWLLLEHGWEQGAAVRALLHDGGLRGVETALDLEGRERVSMGCLGG
ncbi:MAG TPA: peptide chain release factor N(5)-glutamine methyltransferase [Xanthomonadaceae bacterium]|nr:peptide chain release factor N(5)-glutamine methyltransferase [Xanthomonadaceae bacterium]